MDSRIVENFASIATGTSGGTAKGRASRRITGFRRLGLSAWKFDPKTNQYYYHYFYPEQPDLNWRNPAVEKAMLDVTRFWYKRGVAGFRLDAVDTLYEDPKLTDNPVLPGTDKFGRPNMDEKYDKKLPEVHDAMRKLRTAADEYGVGADRGDVDEQRGSS